ncbi:G-protein-signaling modulator 2-like [Dreissena polymorpha]|uniref:G-protein-signaling modulator 2-like n=1 Tax=Dreissena polymorpha TaxID=45954 RepID=UPI00226441D6|nr:G-protein-signaling modulator 2-like [Dreissena polymorpha]
MGKRPRKRKLDSCGEARALYNLGNVYHAKGKHTGRSGNQDPGEFPAEVKECLVKVAEYYEANLAIVQELGDRAAQGRACGNLGNTHYLLGNFSQEIIYHQERLAIAREFGDKSAERGAYSNLGNAHIFLGVFEVAAEHYRWIGDETGQVTAQMNLADLKSVLGIKVGPDEGHRPSPLDHLDVGMYRRTGVTRRHSMEQMELMKLTPDKKGETIPVHGGARPKIPKVQKSMTVATSETIIAKNQAPMVETLSPEDDGFFDLLSKLQGRRIDEQRCSLKLPGEKNGLLESENKENKPKLVSDSDSENFLDMVAGIQGSRMNDQRASLPQFPGLNSQAVINQYLRERNVNDVPDDSFFEVLMRCQGSRIDDQRSALPHNRPAPTVPDEDFFGLIQKVQSSRLEEQRTSLPDKDEISPPQQASVKKKKK